MNDSYIYVCGCTFCCHYEMGRYIKNYYYIFHFYFGFSSLVYFPILKVYKYEVLRNLSSFSLFNFKFIHNYKYVKFFKYIRSYLSTIFEHNICSIL